VVGLLEAAAELADALAGAGLDARIATDPDRGPGVVVDLPSWDFAGRAVRAGCADLTPADLETTITVIGHGWAPEQIEALATDADTARAAVPPPWRPDRGEPAQAELPLYRITCTR
jgi:hypothetical protein